MMEGGMEPHQCVIVSKVTANCRYGTDLKKGNAKL